MTDASDPSAITPLRRALIMLTVCTSTTLYILNQTNVVVALPHMQGAFSTTRDQISWVLTSYIVAMAISLASAGWFSGRFGRKRVYLAALAGFTAASALCGTADSLEVEIAYRLIQGAFAGPIMPFAQAIVLDIYPRERHGTALGLFGVGITLGPVLGPIVGGILIDAYDWRWVFYFNVPFGIALFFAVLAFVPEREEGASRRFDWAGFAALAIALAALQYMLSRGGRLDWFESTEIIVAFSLVLLGTYLFVVQSVTTRHPFLEPAMFRNRNMVLGLFLILGWSMTVASPIVLLSLRLQNVSDYSAIAIGWALVPRGFGGIIAMLLVGPVMRYVRPNIVATFGILCISTAAWTMSIWPTEVTAWEIFWSGFVFGIGSSFAYVPLTVFAFSTIAPRHRTDGSSMLSLVINMGSSIGITVLVIVLTHGIQVAHDDLAQFVSPFNQFFQGGATPGAWDLGATQGLLALENVVQRQATTIAYNNSFRLIMMWTAILAPLTYFLVRPATGARAMNKK
jgi:DHA2 family multidrug resistance protein